MPQPPPRGLPCVEAVTSSSVFMTFMWMWCPRTQQQQQQPQQQQQQQQPQQQPRALIVVDGRVYAGLRGGAADAVRTAFTAILTIVMLSNVQRSNRE